MAISIKKNGFTLLIAIIFMAVVLALGLSLGSLGYKQAVLASSALESQYAFYAADAGLECALRADEQNGTFAYSSRTATPPSAACGPLAYNTHEVCYNSAGCLNQWVLTWQIPIAYANPLTHAANTETRCAVVTIYKPAAAGTTYIFSQGYDVKCASVGAAGIRYASRGLSASYQN